MNQYVNKNFTNQYKATIEADFLIKEVQSQACDYGGASGSTGQCFLLSITHLVFSVSKHIKNK